LEFWISGQFLSAAWRVLACDHAACQNAMDRLAMDEGFVDEKCGRRTGFDVQFYYNLKPYEDT